MSKGKVAALMTMEAIIYSSAWILFTIKKPEWLIALAITVLIFTAMISSVYFVVWIIDNWSDSEESNNDVVVEL